MARFQGLRVSDQWAVILTAAKRAGVRFSVSSGQRTFAQQAVLRRLYLSGRGALAAVPAHTAPHIRTGRQDHALDVLWTDGGVYRLAKWLRRQGASVAWTVPGERWHIETPRRDLSRLARKLDDPLAGYPPSEARWIREYDRLLRTRRGRARRRVLRSVMTEARKRIHRAAEGRGGWDVQRRRARYRALQSRTT